MTEENKECIYSCHPTDNPGGDFPHKPVTYVHCSECELVTEENKLEDWEKEEWNGWKIVSDMLDHPDENGIYPTSKCYKELYDFVCAQKDQAYRRGYEDCIEAIPDVIGAPFTDAEIRNTDLTRLKQSLRSKLLNNPNK